jgi:CBS-domain-containing membrane protein
LLERVSRILCRFGRRQRVEQLAREVCERAAAADEHVPVLACAEVVSRDVCAGQKDVVVKHGALDVLHAEHLAEERRGAE